MSRCPYHSPTHSHWSGQRDLDQDVDLYDDEGDHDGDHDDGWDLEQDVDLDHHRPSELFLETIILTLAEKSQAAKILLSSSHHAILEQFSSCFHAVTKLPALGTMLNMKF